MHFPTVLALLASVVAVQSAIVAQPEVRAVASLLKRQGLTPAQCASSNLAHCKNGVELCPGVCICSGGNLPNGGCCACP
ncbi:hypothetical protein EsH8_VIII_000478 [Colletotrichum jinshuiense]